MRRSHGLAGPLAVLGVLLTGCFDPPPVDDTAPPMLDPTTTDEPPATDEGDTEPTPSTTGDDATSSTGDDATSSTGDPDSTSGTTAGVEDTIYEIQDGTLSAGDTVAVGAVIVTAVGTTGFYVQEPTGGMYSGVFVSTDPVAPSVSRGDEVDVAGTIGEVMGQTVIDVAAGSIDETGVEGIELDPEVVPVAELGPALGEPWEGVLVRVEAAELAVSALPPAAFTVDDGGDVIDIGSRFFDVQASPMVYPNFGIDASFTAIQGPLWGDPSRFQILPREALDLEGYSPALTPEVHAFPIAGDTMVITSGSLPWNIGDYYEGVRTTLLPSIASVDVHIDVVSNGLSACGFQNANVMINGIVVGDFTLQQGTVTVDQSYPLPMPIVGPMVTVRYQTTATVASGCGAAGYSLTTSTITFDP